jgi:hypothetical protein
MSSLPGKGFYRRVILLTDCACTIICVPHHEIGDHHRDDGEKNDCGAVKACHCCGFIHQKRLLRWFFHPVKSRWDYWPKTPQGKSKKCRIPRSRLSLSGLKSVEEFLHKQ